MLCLSHSLALSPPLSFILSLLLPPSLPFSLSLSAHLPPSLSLSLSLSLEQSSITHTASPSASSGPSPPAASLPTEATPRQAQQHDSDTPTVPSSTRIILSP